MVEELNRELRFGLAKAVLLAVRKQEQSVEMVRVATLGASNAGKTCGCPRGGRSTSCKVWKSWLEANYGGRQGGD